MRVSTEAQHDEIIIRAAETFRLDANLLRALMAIESSGGECYKPRLEPSYNYLYHPDIYCDKLGITRATEDCLQRMSWGPLQIMGAVAREMGFESDIPMLTHPDIAIFYASKYLRYLSDRCDDEEHLIAAYNGGLGVSKTVGGMWRNQTYVDKVYRELRRLRALK